MSGTKTNRKKTLARLTKILVLSLPFLLSIQSCTDLSLGVSSSFSLRSYPKTPIVPIIIPKPGVSQVFPNYINQWLVLGTFDNTSNAGMAQDYIGETSITPTEGLVTNTKTWRYFDHRLFSRNFDDYQDLYSYFNLKLNESVAAKVVYAQTYIYSSTAVAQAQVLIGAHSQVKVWLNGQPLTLNGTDYNCGYSGYTNALAAPHCKDDRSYLVSLNPGWNKLLIKVANTQDGQLGFYARVTDLSRQSLTDLVYGLSSSPQLPLRISNRAMADIASTDLPTAFRSWPYYATSFDRATAFAAWNYYQSNYIPAPLMNGNRVLDVQLQASPFMMLAEGGTPPYNWAVTDASLPPGLILEPNGILRGTIDENQSLGTYQVNFTVSDSLGNVIQKSLNLKIQERPNRWYEQARLGSLIHVPEHTATSEIPALVTLMKKQGYQVGTLISYNNGDNRYQWDSPFAPSATDLVTPYATEFRAQGMKFGMYMGMFQTSTDPLGLTFNHGTDMDGALAVVVDAMKKFNPDVLWLDWVMNDGSSSEALYSAIRTINPDTLIILNGVQSRFQGDWDVNCSEGWGAWGTNIWDLQPFSTETWKWPKKGAMETWRFMPTPNIDIGSGPFGNNVDDDNYAYNWAAYLRQMISFIGEGHIVNLDHSVNEPGYTEISPITDITTTILGRAHQKMADWANPPSITPLYNSYTNVDMAPIDPFEEGYAMISLDRMTMYLHFIPNTPKRTGIVPASLTLNGINVGVTSVTWFNKNITLGFNKNGSALTLDLTAINAIDPISTIVKINLAQPLLGTRDPIVNIAMGKTATFVGYGENILAASGNLYKENGVDGSLSTTAAAGGEWAYNYEVDLAATTTFTQISIDFDYVLFATSFEILYSSDRTVWTNIKTVTGNLSGGYRNYIFPAVTARYVRIKALTPNGPAQTGIQMGIAELGVYR